MTVATGVDLLHQTDGWLTQYGVRESVRKKLGPFLGKERPQLRREGLAPSDLVLTQSEGFG